MGALLGPEETDREIGALRKGWDGHLGEAQPGNRCAMEGAGRTPGGGRFQRMMDGVKAKVEEARRQVGAMEAEES